MVIRAGCFISGPDIEALLAPKAPAPLRRVLRTTTVNEFTLSTLLARLTILDLRVAAALSRPQAHELLF
jgi:hypothetical protein